MPTTFRFFLLLLTGLLGSCSLYERTFHPHQLGSTRMPAKMEAEYQAKEKARHKGLTYKPAEEGSNGGAAKDGKAADPKKPLSYSDLPEGTKRKYDKEGLIKDHLPAPTPRHTYETHPLKGTKANKADRKLRHHKKKGDKDNDPAPEKTKDADTPADKEEAPPVEAPAPKGN